MRKSSTVIILAYFFFSLYMFLINIAHQVPNGTDVIFHIIVAHVYAIGQNGMDSQIVIDINRMPYPPVFHLILAPSTLFGFYAALDEAKIISNIFYPLGICSNMLLARKYAGARVAIFFGLLLTGTGYAFNMMQARPEGLEVLLIPLALYTLLENKTKSFIVTTIVMFYTHSPVTVAVCLGMFLYLFFKNKRDLRVWIPVIAVAPMLLWQASYMFKAGFMQRWVDVGDLGMIRETHLFYANPGLFVLNFIGISSFGIALLFYYLFTYKKQIELIKIGVLSVFGSLIIYPFWSWRILEFDVIYFAFFTAYYFAHVHGRWGKILLIACLAQAILFTVYPAIWYADISNLSSFYGGNFWRYWWNKPPT